MTDDALFQLAACGSIAVGVACGIAWARLSESLAIPELLRMLTTAVWTGLLGLVFGSPLACTFFGSKIRNSPHDVGLGTIALSCCAAGAGLGVPGIFGWALGYRQSFAKRRARVAGPTE
jgi:hypothetical protein